MAGDEARDVRVIRDDAGCVHEVDVESDEIQPTLEVHHLSLKVGYVRCIVESGVLKLGDIVIESDVPRIESPLEQFLRTLRSRPRPTVNFQKRGIGSALLRLPIATAREKGFSKIEGFIVAKDVDANPKLLEWYRRHGFVVSEAHTITDQVASISLNLNPTAK